MQFKNSWSTEVGSAMWGMFVPGKSDHDYLTVRICPTKKVLQGYRLTETWPQEKSMGDDGVERDESFIEIGHLINNLIKGTVNHYWAVTSPIVMYNEHGLLNELRSIVRRNPSKRVYKSMKGMAESQKRDETKRIALAGGKGYRTASRTALFGVKLLTDWRFDYNVPSSLVNLDVTEEQVDSYLAMLDEAYENSPLPEKPDEDMYRDFLYRVRKYEEMNML